MFSKRFKCPYCGHFGCHRSRQRGSYEKRFLPMFVVIPVRCAMCFKRRYMCRLAPLVPTRVLIPLVLFAECLVLLSAGLSLGQKIERSIADEAYRPNPRVLEGQVRQAAVPVGSPLANVDDFLPDPGVLPVKQDIEGRPRPMPSPARNMAGTEGEPAMQ